ncbi:hypothetical protein CEXT_716001 [Caerostris extrusa]|uniref:Uncharacterized protein n=1 Tax=Caerostris extrusa TaxID=172846 RepID=A0AAV4P9V6_CAEEX|nr:hypothetical protein CEXT_716001 [Caerostris extrusa]
MFVWYLSHPSQLKICNPAYNASSLMFSVSSSCVNPFIYGSYAFDFKKRVMKFLYAKKIRNTRITAPANRFNETSHLRVSVIPTTNSVITCPVLSQDMEIDEGESMVQVWKWHCSNSCSKDRRHAQIWHITKS